MPQLVCRGLTLGYEGKTVLEGLDFSVEAGDYLWAVLAGERVPDPAERLRTVYHRLLHVEYQQYAAGGSVEEEIQAEKALSPGELFERFYHTMTGGEPTARQRELLAAALDRAARKEEKAV